MFVYSLYCSTFFSYFFISSFFFFFCTIFSIIFFFFFVVQFFVSVVWLAVGDGAADGRGADGRGAHGQDVVLRALRAPGGPGPAHLQQEDADGRLLRQGGVQVRSCQRF